MDPWVVVAFLPAALALNLTPGADMMFVLAQGMRGGPRAGMAANVGIALGCVVHTALAAFGLAALLHAWPVAFELIRWAGVAYLLWMALRVWNAGAPEVADVALRAHGQILRDAFWVNVFNPKVALFILAFVPQFVDTRAPILPQFALLGVIIALGGLLVNGAVALLAGRLRHWLVGHDRASRIMNRVCASLFAALALRLAVTERA